MDQNIYHVRKECIGNLSICAPMGRNQMILVTCIHLKDIVLAEQNDHVISSCVENVRNLHDRLYCPTNVVADRI